MRSLGLTAYKALTRKTETADPQPHPARPSGVVIWAVAQDEAAVRGVIYLAERLRQVYGPCTLLICATGKLPTLTLGPDTILTRQIPDTQALAVRFLDHWQPDACLWLGGRLRPLLIAEAQQRGILMMLLNAHEQYLDQPVLRWLPSLGRETLAAFDRITALTPEARRSLRKMDGARREIALSDPLQIAALPPGVNESVHEELAEGLGGRPVWLAANVQRGELPQVLNAHRASVRVTHRLLLILVAASFDTSQDARRVLEGQGWRVCHWEDGDLVDENTQVILVEEPDDMGLWYRIAPVSFLASSLVPGYSGCDPYVPAALGSAVIYGPYVAAHLSAYSRLAAAGAARIVKDDHGLAHEIQRLLAADQAAAMAHAAWETTSQGAEVTDEVITVLQDHLDARAKPQ